MDLPVNIDTPQKAAHAYWALLELESNAHITTSHHFLRVINEQFGEEAIDAALEPLIEAERKQIAERERQFVEQERSKWLS